MKLAKTRPLQMRRSDKMPSTGVAERPAYHPTQSAYHASANDCAIPPRSKRPQTIQSRNRPHHHQRKSPHDIALKRKVPMRRENDPTQDMRASKCACKGSCHGPPMSQKRPARRRVLGTHSPSARVQRSADSPSRPHTASVNTHASKKTSMTRTHASGRSPSSPALQRMPPQR